MNNKLQHELLHAIKNFNLVGVANALRKGAKITSEIKLEVEKHLQNSSNHTMHAIYNIIAEYDKLSIL